MPRNRGKPAVTNDPGIHPEIKAVDRDDRWKVTTGISLVAAFIALAALFTAVIQAFINRDAEKRNLRAYIYIIPGVNNFQIGQRPTFSVTIRNGGQTPAYDFNLSLNAAIYPFPQKDSLAGKGVQPSPITATKDGIGGFIYKEHESTISLPPTQELSAQDYNDVMSGTEKRLYIWGRLLYLDAFAEDHYLNFCFTVDGASLTRSITHDCVDYNDTDHTPSSNSPYRGNMFSLDYPFF
jgi:hypothetical protein